ncbi:MAG: TIGR03790 family protein [Desulfobulbaceae bacterium]|nr:TIGR03790 family protein [Desulfobulbaceae bacterium]
MRSLKSFLPIRYIITCGLISLIATSDCSGLEPDEVLVVANRFAAKSVWLAEYYMKKRDIPKANLVTLKLTDKETLRRDDYEKRVAVPLRKFLKKETYGKIRCLAIMYGMPLKIAPPELSGKETDELENLKEKRLSLEIELGSAEDENDKKRINQELDSIKKSIKTFKKSHDKAASLDSELALVKSKEYPLDMWISNPYYPGFKGKKGRVKRDDVLMVSRLDGPEPDVVKRIIDQSIATEKKGLKGTAFFDARWPDPGEKQLSGYRLYDLSIHRAADVITRNKIMPVVKDDKEELFQPGDCPNAALYCGWYSLAKYVDAFKWQPGSVGYHIASGECTTLKNRTSSVWCKRMIEEGIAATIGPTGEPYVQGFPLPEIFFTLLTDGYFTLAESYLVALPYLSWKMVLIGDPLYRPFKRPHLPPSPPISPDHVQMRCL